jgi:pimeloyl-ACP methyl ester carboxylesterase
MSVGGPFRAPVVAVIAAAVAVLAGCANLDSFFFSPVARSEPYTLAYADTVPAERRVPAELRMPVEVTAADGTVVHGVFARQPGDAMRTAPTIVYHHGNSSNVDGYWARASVLWSFGANVLIYDYRGYGLTRGTTTEEGIYLDARAALGFVQGLGPAIDQARVFHYGWSMGSAPAVEMVANVGPTRGLILEAPLSSVAGLAADSSLLVPGSFVMHTNRFDNRAKIRRAASLAPNGVLIFHGDADDYVRLFNGEQLDAEIAREPAAGPHRLVVVPGANHGDVVERAGALYETTVREFLAQ